jgi:hypothetical protein
MNRGAASTKSVDEGGGANNLSPERRSVHFHCGDERGMLFCNATPAGGAESG